MSHTAFDLPAFDATGLLNVVIESPRGSRVKFVYQPNSGVFEAERVLGLGVTYPYDWGFICGTRAEDGDPVDALVVDDIETYPGVLIKCHPIAMLDLTQVLEGREETNARIIVAPSWNETAQETLSDGVKKQLEQFFLSAIRLTGKQVTINGWRSADDAAKHIRARVTEGTTTVS